MIKLILKKFYDFANDNQFSEILKGSVWAFTSKILISVTSLISISFIAKFYGANMVGIIAMLNTFLILMQIPTLMGSATSILRFIPEHISQYSVLSAYNIYKKITKLVIRLSIFLGVISFFLSNYIAIHLLNKNDMAIKSAASPYRRNRISACCRLLSLLLLETSWDNGKALFFRDLVIFLSIFFDDSKSDYI